MELANTVNFSFSDLDEAFPQVDPNYVPFGSRVLVQIRLAKKITKGGIMLISEARDTETWNTQVAKVLAVGPMAFRNRNTMVLWPEGAWAEPGQYVRVPKYGGDRWTVKLSNDDEVMFVAFNDLDLGGLIPDPLKMKAFL
jgi:co-chaperonin GroES (HSP10)